MRLHLFSVIVACVAIGIVGGPASASSGGPRDQAIGVAVAGNVSSITGQIDNVRRSGAGWVSFNLGWSLYEPVPDAYEGSGNAEVRWSELERVLRGADQRGLRVLVTFKSTPYWARPPELRGERNAPPVQSAYPEYADFLGDVAREYGQYIDAYATWNEPNIDQFWRGPDPLAYAELHRLAASAIRAADPTARVLLGPFAGNAPGSFEYLARVYGGGVRGTLDAVAWNSYPTKEPEFGLSSLDEQFRLAGYLRRLDPGRRVWLTELSWSTCRQCGVFNVASPKLQADYLLRSYSYRKRYLRGFVDRVFWYNLADGQDERSWTSNHGLKFNDFRPKPSYRALRTLRRSLAAPSGLRRTARSGTASVSLRNIASRRGEISLSARVSGASRPALLVEGFWRGRWRLVERVTVDAPTTTRLRIRDRGYRAVRVRFRPPASPWLVAGRVVPNGPKLTTSRPAARG